MKSKMCKLISFMVTVFVVSLNISAQCGVYFKESSRQVFSHSFAKSYFEDFDNDGLDDLFGYSKTSDTGYNQPTSFQIRYYKRLSENAFDTSAKSTALTNVTSEDLQSFIPVIGDVNADGKKDLIVRHHPQTIRTYLNDGTGEFTTATPEVSSLTNEIILAAADLNNDGKADIVSSVDNGNNSTLYYRLAQNDNSFGPPITITNFFGFMVRSVWQLIPLIIEDLDNNGTKDIAFVSSITDDYLYVLTNNGNLTFSETLFTVFSNPRTKLKTVDLNNDGKKDFVSHVDYYRHRVVIAINNGDNSFTTSSVPIPTQISVLQSYYTKEFSISDFDNDGDLDLLYSGSRSYIVLKNDGNQNFVLQEFKSFLTMDHTADIDGDGKRDIITLVSPVIDGSYRLPGRSNAPDYQLHNAVIFRKNVCNPVGQTKIVDFDGDGIVDERAFWNPESGIWRIYPSNGQFFASNQTTFRWGLGSLGDVTVPNDYDGDGKTDYAVFRRSDGTWWVHKSSDGQNFAFRFGISEDKPVPADYDGDGKADIAVYRPSTGVWHFWLSQTNQYTGVKFGIAEDKPVPADFDGDGKADVNVYRPSTGEWFRINSSDLSFYVVRYGINTDIPIPGDYDGDGKANVAVFRNGVWYVLRDDSSTSLIYFGLTNDQPVFNESPVMPSIAVYRQSTSSVWLTKILFPSGINGRPTGNSANEVWVSSILPPQ